MRKVIIYDSNGEESFNQQTSDWNGVRRLLQEQNIDERTGDKITWLSSGAYVNMPPDEYEKRKMTHDQEVAYYTKLKRPPTEEERDDKGLAGKHLREELERKFLK